jgi:16S rRNA processing protein RimM
MKIIKVGKIGSTYGVRGWIKVLSYTEYGDNILDYKPWYLSKDKENWKPVEIEDGRMHGDRVIVKFKGIDTPEKAALLTGNVVGITRSQLPTLKENEFYWSDLEGLTVINKNGDILGNVIYLIETGSNDVLVVKGEKEHAIPYLFGDVVLSVDLEKKEIHVDWELL